MSDQSFSILHIFVVCFHWGNIYLRISPSPFYNVAEDDECHHQVDDDDYENDDGDEEGFIGPDIEL